MAIIFPLQTCDIQAWEIMITWVRSSYKNGLKFTSQTKLKKKDDQSMDSMTKEGGTK